MKSREISSRQSSNQFTDDQVKLTSAGTQVTIEQQMQPTGCAFDFPVRRRTLGSASEGNGTKPALNPNSRRRDPRTEAPNVRYPNSTTFSLTEGEETSGKSHRATVTIEPVRPLPPFEVWLHA